MKSKRRSRINRLRRFFVRILAPGPSRELLGRAASFEDVADILGNSTVEVRKHYPKCSPAHQARINELMEKVHPETDWTAPDNLVRIQ